MKKYLFTILSFILLVVGSVVGGGFLSPSFESSAEEGAVINIGTAGEFVSVFSTQSTYNDETLTVRLSTDLDFSQVDLAPITQGKNVFMGTFDGNGYTISNITLQSSMLYYGLIPYAKNATIQNLRISGDVEFVFDEENIQEVYAGIILGHGENVTIKNCELDNTITNIDTGAVTYDGMTIPVYSNVNFGFLAGKIKGNPNATNQLEPANILNCVNYYNANIVVNSYSIVRAGGLVGSLENCYMLDNMNYGNITYSKNLSLIGDSSNNQYFGGLAGTISGSGTNIRNNIIGGQITSYEDISGLSAYAGSIFGGAISTSVEPMNISYDYYTQEGISPCGDNYIQTGDNIKKVDIVNKNFLTTAENFDQSVQSWDFDKTWALINSKFHVQNFQIFQYDFNTILDRSQIIETAQFCLNGSENGSDYFNAKYGMKLDIRLLFKKIYQGFYYINENNPFILLNNNQYSGQYDLKEITSTDGSILGYTISIDVNSTTAGTYSFVISQKTYSCQIEISQEAQTLSQGGVRVISDSIQSKPTTGFTIPFAFNSEAKQIIAESSEGSVYSFDHWELYYPDENGEYTGEPVEFDQSSHEIVNISFGTTPFTKEFKLVAFFTDEKAILFEIGEIGENIKSIQIEGIDYVAGQPMKFSATRVVNIEVVTNKDYILNNETIAQFITELYGDNPSPHPVEKESTVNELGETTYIFTIDLNYAKDNIKNNQLEFEFYATQDKSNDNSDLLWLFITLPAVFVIGVGLTIFFVVRNRRGGGRTGGKTKTSAQKEKKASYKDYY